MRRYNRMNGNDRSIPFTNNGEIILNSLVVDICARLMKGHRHFGVTDSFGNSGHVLGKPSYRAPCLGRTRGEVEHRWRCGGW